MSEVDVLVLVNYDGDELDQLLRNVQLERWRRMKVVMVTMVICMLTLRPHCSRLSGLPQMRRLTAKRDWHPMRGGTENGAKREAQASGQPC